MWRVASIGECMIEVVDFGDGTARLGFAGDTLNTAVYLARCGVPVTYHTALGDDEYSEAMVSAWRDEGIDVGWVERVPGTLPGLYLSRTDARGERSFRFWRDASPARRLTVLPRWTHRTKALCEAELIYLSAITLGILGPAGREQLLEALRNARAAGARIAFDSNYRPRNWESSESARAAVRSALALTDIALPTWDDECALFGDADVAETIARLRDCGVGSGAVKLGQAGCVVFDAAQTVAVPAPPVADVVDTTAAGDSFNAAFLAALGRGAAATDAAVQGNRLAAAVIRHRGALIPRREMPALRCA